MKNSRLCSLLFCPATAEVRVRKIPQLGADAVAIDLEDAVASDRKVDARDLVPSLLEEFGGMGAYVRVNNVRSGLAEGDVAAVVHPNLDGIVLSKVESADEVRLMDQCLEEAERANGLPVGSVSMLLLIESAKGIHSASAALEASDRVETGIFGYVDFMVDVGIERIDTSASAEEVLFARSSLVVSARVADRRPPLDGPFIDIKDVDGCLAQCRQARTLGYYGKMLIHPDQIGPAHAGFHPSEDEAREAQRVIDAWIVAEANGTAAIMVDGRLVDYPVAERARRIVAASQSRRA